MEYPQKAVLISGTITRMEFENWPAPSYAVALRWYEEAEARGLHPQIYTGGATGIGVSVRKKGEE